MLNKSVSAKTGRLWMAFLSSLPSSLSEMFSVSCNLTASLVIPRMSLRSGFLIPGFPGIDFEQVPFIERDGKDGAIVNRGATYFLLQTSFSYRLILNNHITASHNFHNIQIVYYCLIHYKDGLAEFKRT